MGRSRKCNWKRKLKKEARKAAAKGKLISGFDYYKLNFYSNSERNEKWWDEMYRQYKEFGSNIIFQKSRRGGYNSGIIMEMAIEFSKRSGHELIHVKPNENKERLKGASFDLYDGVDPDSITRIHLEKLREYWEAATLIKTKNGTPMNPIIQRIGGQDSGKDFSGFWNEKTTDR